MCRLRNKAVRDYQESVTTGQTHRHRRTDRQTGRTDRRRTKWSLCAAMHHRRHENYIKIKKSVNIGTMIERNWILIKRFFKTFSLRCYAVLLRMSCRRCFHGINVMILMPQVFDVTANENARYKRNEWELSSTRLESSSMKTCYTLWRYKNHVTTSPYKALYSFFLAHSSPFGFLSCIHINVYLLAFHWARTGQ